MKYEVYRRSLELTRNVDGVISDLFLKFGVKKGWAIIAIGGYGREDLCPYSDIDILLLAEGLSFKSGANELVNAVIYPLWDDGFNAAYSVRTVKETLDDMNKDFFLKTSLLNMRFIAGERRLFTEIAASIANSFRKDKNKISFIKTLMIHDAKRHEKFGDDSYILEPDIKDGQGGLRDFHSILWLLKGALDDTPLEQSVSKGLMSQNDLSELLESVRFLLKSRFRLHIIAGRKHDSLSFEYQEGLAESMEMNVSEIETPVEAFMKKFHASASIIKALRWNIAISLMDNLGMLKDSTEKNPGGAYSIKSGMINFSLRGDGNLKDFSIMDIFLGCAKTGRHIHPSARTLIRDNLELIIKGRGHQSVKDKFIQIMNSDYPYQALTQMLETGVLEMLIPEFARIRSMIQFDVYHVNTVDMHSIRTVKELKLIEESEKKAFSYVADKEALMIAGLLHDIGKGSGGRHASTGSALAYDIAMKLGLNEKRAETVSFLVRNHLIIPHTSTRRDLTEEKTVFAFARTAVSTERLSMLYLLSIADSSATGPAAFNEWKRALFRELYVKAMRLLETGELRGGVSIKKLDKAWEDLKRLLPEHFSSMLWMLPQHYLLHYEAGEIINHFRLCVDITKSRRLRVETKPAGEHFTLTVITRDKPGLFARLAYIIDCMGLDVLSAKVFTWNNGMAVDVFDVIPPWNDYDRWDRFEELFMTFSECDMNASVLQSEKLCVAKGAIKPVMKAVKEARIDNDSSDFFSVIEVKTGRGNETLYKISDAISENGLSIHRAFITTDGDLSVNIFYVVSRSGEKIEGRDAQSALISDILNAISSFE